MKFDLAYNSQCRPYGRNRVSVIRSEQSIFLTEGSMAKGLIRDNSSPYAQCVPWKSMYSSLRSEVAVGDSLMVCTTSRSWNGVGISIHRISRTLGSLVSTYRRECHDVHLLKHPITFEHPFRLLGEDNLHQALDLTEPNASRNMAHGGQDAVLRAIPQDLNPHQHPHPVTLPPIEIANNRV